MNTNDQEQESNKYFFIQGMTVGFLTFCLRCDDDKERIRDCFIELVESYYLLRLEPILMFRHFEDSLENLSITWEDIDKLLAALENEPEHLEFLKGPINTIRGRINP